MNTFQKSEASLTKDSIFSALMLLMKKKKFSEITITEITSKAGVSRMAYYRHFTSKEDIFGKHLEDMFEAYKSNVIAHRNNLLHATILFFAFFRSQEDMLVNIQKAHLDLLLLNRFNDYIHHLLPHLDFISREGEGLLNYKIDFIAGGMFQMLMKWSKEGMKASDDKMGELAQSFLESILLKDLI